LPGHAKAAANNSHFVARLCSNTRPHCTVFGRDTFSILHTRQSSS
jgi:hypothetical protein